MYKVWCEWDLGEYDVVFTTRQKALDWAKKQIQLEDPDAPEGYEDGWFESLLKDDMVGVDECRVDPV